jgi:hypothetical protein
MADIKEIGTDWQNVQPKVLGNVKDGSWENILVREASGKMKDKVAAVTFDYLEN